jgi:adenine-specific DNA-methyltransferase
MKMKQMIVRFKGGMNMHKLKMYTPDKTKENFKRLAELFPNAVTETIIDGEVVRAIDADVLRQEISTTVVEGAEERYQFTWPDKKKSIMLANSPIAATLRPNREESINFDTTGNLYIEGDNLDVLKLMLETYLGKVKMIYIDPPYNTGKDFIYEDDFAEESGEFLRRDGQCDEQGNRLTPNLDSNGRFHTDWLNMVYPRLRLAKDLLSDNGVIFISIDDGEVAGLRKICDEVFGEGNFVSNLIWQKKFSRANDATFFSTMHDHILCYCKRSILVNDNGWRIGLLPRGNDVPPGYSNPDCDPRGFWASVVLSAKSGSEKLLYEITTPSGRKCRPPSGRFWSVSKEKYDELVANNRIWFGSNGDGAPRLKTFLSEVQAGLRPNSILFHAEAGHNQEGKQETKALFDGIGVFDGPKPIRLLKLLGRIANLSESDIVLDFFSGSATTAHAVMQLNAEDGGKRKFIMVQLPEPCDENSEAYTAGYNNICEIGKERIRRAGKRIKDDSPLAAADLDIGFRVLKLDSSNMKDVYYTPDKYEHSLFDQLTDNIKEDRTPEDLLFQVMLDLGVLLSSKIERREVSGKTVFSVADNFLIACFDSEISDDVVKEIAQLTPYYAVFRDSSFAADSVAANFEQIFTTYSPSTVRRVL